MQVFTSICHLLCGARWTQAGAGLLELPPLCKEDTDKGCTVHSVLPRDVSGEPCPRGPMIQLTSAALILGAKVSCPRKWLVKKEDPEEESMLSRRDGRRMRRCFQVADPAWVKGQGLPEQASLRNRRKPGISRMSQPFWNNPSALISTSNPQK